MGITRTLLTSGWSTTDATSFSTASITPQAGKVYFLALFQIPSGTATEPTVTGAGMNWSLVDRTPLLNNVRWSAIYLAVPGAGAAAGALTINYGAITHTGYAWFVFEVNGADTQNPVVQSVQARPTGTTSVDVPFNAAVDPANATLAITGCSVNQNIVAGAGWTEGTQYNMTSPASACQTEFSNSALQDVTCSWASSANGFVVGVEIKAAPPNPTLRGVYGHTAQTTASPVNITNVVVKKDDVVVVVALTSDYLRRIDTTPTGLTGVTFVEEGGVYGWSGYGNAYSWTAKAQQDETVTISLTPTGGNAGANYEVVRVYVAQNAEGAGDTIAGGGWASAKGSGLPSLTQTNVADNSIVLFASVDWNAVSAAGAAFSSTGGAGAPTTDLISGGSAAGWYFAEYLTAGLKGSKTVGMTAPSGQKWSAIAIEIVGKGLGPQVPRDLATLQMDSVAGMSVGGSVTTPTNSALLALAAAASASFGPSMVPVASAVLPVGAAAALSIAPNVAKNATISATAAPRATIGPLRQTTALLAAAASSGAAFSVLRTASGVFVVRATATLAPNTGTTAVVAMRATPALALAPRQSYLRTLAAAAAASMILFGDVVAQRHDYHKVIARVLDSGVRVALLDPSGGEAVLLPAGALADLLGAGH